MAVIPILKKEEVLKFLGLEGLLPSCKIVGVYADRVKAQVIEFLPMVSFCKLLVFFSFI